MELKEYTPGDCSQLAELFFQTVHSVNARDYTKDQLEAWATGTVDLVTWEKTFLEHHTIIAEEAGVVLGFGDMDIGGYLDRLYVHKNAQNRGVATAIADRLEQCGVVAGVRVFTTHASITAKHFFEKRGYRVVCKNEVLRGGVFLTNYTMEKAVAEGSASKIALQKEDSPKIG